MRKNVFRMKKSGIKKILYFLPIVCLVLCNCGSKKITQQNFGNIAGKVCATGTGLPIPGVLVSCSGISDTTDSSGAYSLSNIPVGLRTVSALKAGYQPWSASIDVRKGNNTLDIFVNSITPTAKGIVFYSQRTGSTQLFVMDSDGSKQQQLTNLSMQWSGDRGPLWSPDKERIAFVTSLTRSSQEIMLINSDGTGLDTLVREYVKFVQLGDWSSDGNQIVYQIHDEMPPFYYEIFIINSDGTNNVKLDDGQQPRFCGNDKVVYAQGGNIYRINTDGTGEEQLTDSVISGQKAYYYYLPVGSPDGGKVAFGVDLGIKCYHYALGMMNSDGTGDTLLVWAIGLDGIKAIEFSPDGQKILFLTNDGDNSEIFVINVDGSGLYSLTDGIACADGGASWSPDGNWIAFTSNKKGNKDIYKVSVDGKILVQLTDDVADDFSPDW